MEVLDWDFIILAFSFLFVSRNVGVFFFWVGGGGTGAGLLTVFWLCFFLFIVLHVIVDFSWSFFSSRFVGYAILKICH